MPKMALALGLLFFVVACAENRDQSNADTAGDSTATDPPTAAADTVALANYDFNIQCGESTTNAEGYPRVPISITAPGLLDRPLYLATDYICGEASEDLWSGLDIPADAEFGLNTYYAGAGYYYYGIVEDNQLKVYRDFFEEGTPDNKPEPRNYQLFKAYRNFGGQVQVDSFDVD